MEHWRLVWLQDLPEHDPDFPVVVFSELDDAGYEIRKVEVFPDGRHDYADQTRSTGNTELSDQRIEEIDKEGSPELEVSRISRQDFDQVWRQARAMRE